MDFIFTVSQINHSIRQRIESDFPLMWVQGETSNVFRAASGHIYFTLKDEHAQINCVMFRMRAQLLPIELKSGVLIKVHARPTLYEPRGDLQLRVEKLEPAGEGALYEQFLRLREKLSREGLLSDDRKRPLPIYPLCIAIITSAQGAVLHDIKTVLKRRAPHIKLILLPVPVQGGEAPAKIIRALALANTLPKVDAILIARGGGSLEDLSAFNDETLARAIASCPRVVVCGVGHETDVTLADFVADVRASTPSAAAELLSAGFYDAAQRLIHLPSRLAVAMNGLINIYIQAVDRLGLRLQYITRQFQQQHESLNRQRHNLQQAMRQRLHEEKQRVAYLEKRLQQQKIDLATFVNLLTQQKMRLRRGMVALQHRWQQEVLQLGQQLKHLSPYEVLSRGYAIVRDKKGLALTSSVSLKIADALNITFAQGEAATQVTQVIHPEPLHNSGKD